MSLFAGLGVFGFGRRRSRLPKLPEQAGAAITWTGDFGVYDISCQSAGS